MRRSVEEASVSVSGSSESSGGHPSKGSTTPCRCLYVVSPKIVDLDDWCATSDVAERIMFECVSRWMLDTAECAAELSIFAADDDANSTSMVSAASIVRLARASMISRRRFTVRLL